MNKIEPALRKACEKEIEIRNLWLGTKEIDKTDQLNVFFQDDEGRAARTKAMYGIKNRFGQKYNIKAKYPNKSGRKYAFFG